LLTCVVFDAFLDLLEFDQVRRTEQSTDEV
jgi:hypothetical protein